MAAKNPSLSKKKTTEKATQEQLSEQWAERIRTAIDQSAMTDLDIAREVTQRGISLSPRTIYNWKLNGGMSRDYIDPFCEVVGCDKLWMLTGNKSGPLELVHSKDEIKEGLEQRHIPIPLLETTDLMAVTETHEMADDQDDATRLWMHETAENWITNPTQMTEVYIPYLFGHKHDEEIPGTPRYAIQVSQSDHDYDNAPWLWQGQLLCMATDVWPSRDEFCMWMRRPIHEDGTTGLWSLHAGFFRADAHSYPKDADMWWHHASRNKVDRYFTLHVRQGEHSSDDTIIHFQQHQWCYLGVCVFKMGWTGGVRTMANTRLLDRKSAATRRRSRAEDGVPFVNLN